MRESQMATAFQHLLTVGTKIVAVGRNYAAHAKELGNAVPKVSPLPVSLSFNSLFGSRETAGKEEQK